jgi:hypothetical protein
MAGYFSFRKNITTYFVKSIYALGFIILTGGGVGLAVWAGRRLNAATMPTRTAVYYIAAGVGIALVGNLAWRMICEFWLLLFNIHASLVSIEKVIAPEQSQRMHDDATSEVKRERAKTDVTDYGHVAPRGVLGLS